MYRRWDPSAWDREGMVISDPGQAGDSPSCPWGSAAHEKGRGFLGCMSASDGADCRLGV